MTSVFTAVEGRRTRTAGTDPEGVCPNNRLMGQSPFGTVPAKTEGRPKPPLKSASRPSLRPRRSVRVGRILGPPAESGMPLKGVFCCQKQKRGPPPGPASSPVREPLSSDEASPQGGPSVSFAEVAPAASGRLSVADALSGWLLHLIHHPLAVDYCASLANMPFCRDFHSISFSAGKAVEQHLREFAQGGREMEAHIGDSIVVESERVGQPAHTGVIEDVLQQQPPRYRVRWEDGHESIVTPAAGAARIEPKQTAH